MQSRYENIKKERNEISLRGRTVALLEEFVEVGDVKHDGPGTHRQVVDYAGESWPVSGKLSGTGQDNAQSRNPVRSRYT